MKSDKRPKVRPQPQVSADKVFTPIVDVSKRIPRGTFNPLVVAADLRRGSFKSLDGYLATHNGIPDHEVALALRELISGAYPQAKYRIWAVEHPDAPRSSGGRPKVDGRPAPAEMEAVAAYDALPPMKKMAAYAQIAADTGWSVAAVRKAIRKVRAHQQRLADKADAISGADERRRSLAERREAALTSLRATAPEAE